MESIDDQRPIWDLIEEAAGELDSPMTAQDILDWFTEHHSDVLPHTLRSQIAVAVGNRRSYLNHPLYSRRPPCSGVGRDRYEAYELERHGEPGLDVDKEPVEDQTPEAGPPVWQLIAQAARELVAPFSLQAVVDWFEDNYPDIPAGSVRTQVSDWSGNSPAYIFNPAFNRRRPVLWRVARGQYGPYDERRHGEVVAASLEAAEASAADSVEAVQEFVLEQCARRDRLSRDRRDLTTPERAIGPASPLVAIVAERHPCRAALRARRERVGLEVRRRLMLLRVGGSRSRRR